jgi:NAD(P)-dependent dehydrogenase (short-subunit alcohol dehydrogenase family)
LCYSFVVPVNGTIEARTIVDELEEIMSKQLQGKTAVVTGASRGIGRAIALALARAGANVVVHYGKSEQPAQALVAELRAMGVKSEAIGANLARHDEVIALFPKLDAALKRINGSNKFDILINNAGIAPFTPFAQVTAEEFDEVFAVNVKAPLFITQQSLSRLNDSGRIINMSSVVARGVFFADTLTPYAASKGAVDTLTAYLAEIAAPRNITVNSVNPGVIETDMAKFARTAEGAEHAKSLQVLKRVGQPEDVADIVAFLASPAARWITGQNVDASGGTKL